MKQIFTLVVTLGLSLQLLAAGQSDAGDDAADVRVSHESLTGQTVAGCILHSDRADHSVFLEVHLAEPAGVSSSIRDELEAA